MFRIRWIVPCLVVALGAMTRPSTAQVVEIQVLPADLNLEVGEQGIVIATLFDARGKKRAAEAARKIAGDLPDLRRLRPDVPDTIVAVLQRGAAKNPEERFDSANAFREALRAASGRWSGGLRKLRGLFGAR